MTTAAKEALKAFENSYTGKNMNGQGVFAIDKSDQDLISAALTHPTAPEVEEAIADIKNNVLGRGCVSEYSENSIETLITAATQKGK